MGTFSPQGNKLVFPAGRAPGFNPRNVAAGNARFSGVSCGSSFINVMNGANYPGAGTGVVVDGRLGPATTISTNGITVSGLVSETPAAATIAALVSWNVIDASTYEIGDFDSGANNALRAQNGSFRAGVGGTLVASGLTVAALTPYFVAATIKNAVAVDFLVLNLATGVIKTATITTAGTLAASGGGLTIGSALTTVRPLNGTIAAYYYAASYIGPIGLKALAADPWSLWYPQRQAFRVGSVAAGFSPWWANNNNSPVLGTGTY